MNDLGLAMAWSAVQVSLVLIPAVALQAIASRRGPASGSWAASWGLGLIAIMGLWAVFPRVSPPAPTPGGSSARVREAQPLAIIGQAARLGGDPKPSPDRRDGGPSWSIASLRIAWERLERDATAPVARYRHWGSTLAIIVLAGIGTGLLRMLIGVWAVHLCRRRGRLVDDPDLTRLLEELRADLGCLRRVEVREIPDLTTPATAGWRHPLVMLPDDWRSWDDHERRAVLAHELAHILRDDYAAGLVARLALVLHFYHPAVRWMAGRLQLQQELAADALGARFAGGRARYLHSLSRLALRQDGRSSYWPARAFLPTRGTLIRRIAMLRDETVTVDRPWSRSLRVMAGLLLVGIAVGVSSLRSPALGAGGDDGPKRQEPSGNRWYGPIVTQVDEAPTGRLTFEAAKADQTFDLSYIPDDAMGFIALRPAAAFRKNGMGPFIAGMNSHIGQVLKASRILQDQAKSPIRIEAIDQATLGITIESMQGKNGSTRRIEFHCLMMRMTEPFDWRKLLFSRWPDMAEIHDGERVYYKAIKPLGGLGPDGCFYIPDSKTVVVGDEERMLRMIRRSSPSSPTYARGADWDRVSRGLVAAVLDNHDGRWTHAFKVSDAEAIGLPATVQDADRWTWGLADTDDFLLQAIVTCADARATEATARATEALLDTCRHPAVAPKPGEPAAKKAMLRLFSGLVADFRVDRQDRSVVLRSAGLGRIADIASAVQAVGAH